MKSYSCELCNSTQFIKEDGFFICQGCGMRYSLVEMKKLLTEVQDGEATPTATLREEPKPTPRPEPATASYNEPAVEAPVYQEKPKAEPVFSEKPKAAPAPEKPKAAPSAPKKAPGKEKKKSKIKIKYIIAAALALATVIYFITNLLSALSPESDGSANTMLIISGIAELIVAFVLYKIMIHMERYNCPACAAKRVHHRAYVRTTEVDKEFSNQGGQTYKTIYTHHYVDTYECPKCGETRTERITASGGEYTVLGSGKILDTRKPPKEF